MNKIKAFILILIITFVGLSAFGFINSDIVLKDKNFTKGDWILVHRNCIDETIEIIDQEDILSSNKYGIRISFLGDCQGTTCDGFLTLYCNGEFIKQYEYLSRTSLFITEKVHQSFKKANQVSLKPTDEIDFTKKWDSLIQDPKSYPIIRHTQPEDKNNILVYQTN